MRTGKDTRSFWRNGLVLVTVVLLIMFAVFYAAFSLIYRSTLSQLTQSAMEETMRQMEAVSGEVSRSFLREWMQMQDVQFIEKTKRQFSAEELNSESYSWYYRLLNLKTELSSRFTESEVFHDVALLIVTDDRDFLCTAHFISDHFERDWNAGLYSFDDAGYDDFLNMIRAAASQRYRLSPVRGTITYLYDGSYTTNSGLFVYAFTQSNASVQIYSILHVDMDGLEAKYTALQYAGDDVLLYGNDTYYETLLTSDGEGRYTDGAGNIWLRTSIERTGLNCMLKLDQEAIRNQIDSFTLLLKILPLVFFALLVFLTVLLFLRWHYPVLRIAEQISTGSSTGKTPVARISSRIMELEDENERIQKRISRMRPAAEEKLLEDFLNGDEMRTEELNSVEIWTNLESESSFRCIVSAPLTEKKTGMDIAEIMVESARELLRGMTACAIVNGKLVALIDSREGDDEVFFADQRTLLDALNVGQTEQALFATGVSERYVGWASVPAAYQEALSGWKDAMLWQNASVVFHEVRGSDANSYHFSYQQLMEMVEAVRSGNGETALRIFDAVVRENFDAGRARRLRQVICRQFYEDITGLLVRLATEFDIGSSVEDLSATAGTGSLTEQIARLRRALQESAELIATAADRKGGLTTEMQSYCQEHMSDPMLSLSEAADHFGLTESNMSKYFKSHTGVSFSSYVEKLRIHEADCLLLSGEMNVRQIALAVGYQNTATFYNAFRRIHQCTPTQWQEQFSRQENYAENDK